MKEGSLVVPSDKFLKDIPEYIAGAPDEFTFIPRIPVKEDIFVCTSIYMSLTGKMCITVDGLKVVSKTYGDVDLNTYLFDEIQPPMDIVLEEIMEDVMVLT